MDMCNCAGQTEAEDSSLDSTDEPDSRSSMRIAQVYFFWVYIGIWSLTVSSINYVGRVPSLAGSSLLGTGDERHAVRSR
jgi:hypothetical protein